jgi:hypothetical protein
MFITKRSLSRRTFLRGTGVVIALPLLDAMLPALTPLARAQARPRTRFGAIYVPNGAISGSRRSSERGSISSRSSSRSNRSRIRLSSPPT